MNPTCFLTGATSGIGRALALHYARQGWVLGLLSRRQDVLCAVASECLQAGSPQVQIYAGDAADALFVARSVQAFVAASGRVDVVIANAGVGYPGVFLEQDWQNITTTFATNTFAPLQLFRCVVPLMHTQGGGQFAVVSSLGAWRGAAFSTSYNASKAAVTAFFEGLRAEVAAQNILVSIISPGFVDTPMTRRNRFKMPFLQTPERAARVIAKGLAQKKRYIVFPPPMLWLVRLARLLPARIYDWVVLRAYRPSESAGPVNHAGQSEKKL